MIRKAPARGEIWDADLSPTRGREQSGRRPALVVSVDLFNEGPADLAVVVPLTRTNRGVRWHVPLQPPEGGLKTASFLMVENVRSVSRDRFARLRGRVGSATMESVEDRLRILMGL